MPLFRREFNYSFSSAVTKVLPKHELRAGIDIVKLRLDHRQAEWGPYGLKGGLEFSGSITSTTGYISPGWNSYAAFLLGRSSAFIFFVL